MIARWNKGRDKVDGLIARGDVERVSPSRELADRLIAQARTHITTAGLVTQTDPPAAFQTTYDAARKALAALLANQGLRVSASRGAHVLLLWPPRSSMLSRPR